MYTASALSLVIGRTLGNNSVQYAEEPLLAKASAEMQVEKEEEEEILSPEEIKRRREQFFTNLHIFSANVQLAELRERLAKEQLEEEGEHG